MTDEWGAERDVEAVNMCDGIALLTDGQTIPITGWFAMDEGLRDEPCHPKAAVSAVAGPDRDGKWYSIDLSRYERRRSQ